MFFDNVSVSESDIFIMYFIQRNNCCAAFVGRFAMSSRSLPLFNAVLSSEVGVAIEFDFLDRFQGRFAKFRATLQNLFVEVAAFLVHNSDGDLHIIIEFGRTNLMTILMRIRKRRCMKIIAKIRKFLEKYTPFLP